MTRFYYLDLASLKFSSFLLILNLHGHRKGSGYIFTTYCACITKYETNVESGSSVAKTFP